MNKTCALAFAFVCALGVSLPAKGPTTRIIVRGADLREPIEIVDPSVLRNFNVYSGPGTQSEGFIVESAQMSLEAPPKDWPRYEVSFFRGSHQPIYVVTYQINPSGPGAYVYIPPTALNCRTIGRGGMDDWWYRSSSAWERVIRPLIRDSRRLR